MPAPRSLAAVLVLALTTASSGCGGCAVPGSAPRLADAAGVDPELVTVLAAAADVVDADPGDRDAWLELAQLLDGNQLPSLAAPCYEAALDREEDARTTFHLGRVRAALGEPERALQALDRAAELDGDYAPVHWRRGELLEELGRLDDAQAAFRRALELAPGEPQALLGLARVHLARDRAQAAVEVLEGLVEERPHERFANGLLARAYRQVGRPRRAERALRREERAGTTSARDPWTAEVQARAVGAVVTIDRASAALRAGDTRTVRRLLEPLLAERPEELPVLDLFVRALILDREFARALVLTGEARALHGDHFRVELATGSALAGLGRLEEALPHLESAVRQQPRLAEAHTALGEALQRLDRLPEAESAYARALEEGADSVRDWSLLARARIRLDRLDDALATLADALEDYPNAPVLWANVADAEARRGDVEAARAALARVEARDPTNDLIEPVRARIRALEEGSSGGG
jgi:tetratricopeptide (TPR) repeat protein